MTRQPIHALVIPYRLTNNENIEYAVFQRPPTEFSEFWQWISGGVEDDETLLETAKREAWEEAGIDPGSEFAQLESTATIPAEFAAGFLWGPDILLIKEFTFGVKVTEDFKIILSEEHRSFAWMDYESAFQKLKFDSNKNALWELNYRLLRK